jgi:Zn-dependent protease
MVHDPFVLVVGLAIFVMSVVAHEVAHGWVALQCGDPTALKAGRLTLNPVRHIDPVRTVLLPLFIWFASSGTMIFGGAKPVPVNPFLFRHFRRDNILVSLAGVATNIAIAVGLATFLRVLLATNFFQDTSPGTYVLVAGVQVNLLLAFFNLMPIPPLDGSHVVAVLLPRELAEPYERIGQAGFVILLLLLWFQPFWRILGAAIHFSTRLLVGG